MRLSRGIYFLLLCLGTLLQTSWAQSVSLANTAVFRVDHIGVSDGLTQGSVYSMLKDSRGFLWFGTQDGLNRYDGHRFRTYRPAIGARGSIQPGTIRGVNVFGIVEDPAGNLWVGTEEGLNRYDRQRDRFDCFFARGPGKKPLTSRNMPFFADQNEVLYLSDSEGLVRFEYKKRHKTILAATLRLPNAYDLQSSTVRTPTGDVWLQAPMGLMRYSPRTNTIAHYFSDDPTNRFGPAQSVLSFWIDADEIAWIGTDTGLIRFDYRHNTYETYATVGRTPISAIYSIAPDQRGRLWLGTQRNGVLYFDKRSRMFGQATDFITNTQRLSEFKISKVYVDNTGIVWANTDPDGLARIIPDAFLFGGLVKRLGVDTLPANQRLSNYTVRGFLEERFDRLWVLTENGINVIDPRTNRVTERFLTRSSAAKGPNQPLIKSLYRDPQRRIWVGRTGGVLAYEPLTKTFDPILFTASSGSLSTPNYVRNLVSITDTLLIAATEDGLYALNTLRRQWRKVPVLNHQNIFSVWYEATTRQLWVGTYLNGYYSYRLPQTAWPAAGNRKPSVWPLVKSGLKGYTILHIRPDASGQHLWLSCDRGLVALNASTSRFRLYAERQGLANSFVYGSFIDARNNIWMSTNRGVSRLDPVTQTLKNFTPDDGLQGYEFNGNAFLHAANGELYFGGVNGFNRFRPDDFRISSVNPYAHIYSLTINEEPFSTETYIGEARQIDLDHTQTTLALEFAALDFTSNGHNAYQYQLMNYDEQWVDAGERNYVRYANLPPGNYVFQVRAANRDGHWSTHLRKLFIHIEPPFWQKIPFILLVILSCIGAVWVWIKQRENAIRRQQADRVRLAYDIQEQVKKDIARDIHDEIGTRLATIKLYTTQLTQQAGETPTILSLKNTIFQLINDTIGDVRNLLRKLNPQTLERHGYVAAVDELFSRIDATGVINAHFEPSDPAEPIDRLPADMEVMLYRITQELVNNSLKHANAHQIDLHISQQTDQLLLTYQDDGQGFNYEQTQKKSSGLGIGNIESRVAILGGQISWQSGPGQGLQATIKVPLGLSSKRHFFDPTPRQPLST
ncbi:sensor histidine kinase [Spirosoma areae]